MTETMTGRPPHKPGIPDEHHADTSRMSFGDHLDELRICVIRALVGVAVATALALFFGKTVLEIVLAPLHVALIANDLPPSVQVLAPTGAFIAYLKLSILTGLLVSAPWVLFQVWVFVATGLYDNERRFVLRLIPASVLLFVVGVTFLYYIVLPIVLNFFIAFNRGFDVGSTTHSAFQRLLLSTDELPAESDQASSSARIPLRAADPESPTEGDIWVNTTSKRLTIQHKDGPLSVPLAVGSTSAAMSSQFALDFYISFVLMLALAFGIAFEMPIVVFFLAWSGLASTQTMAKSRRYVLLASVVAAAVLTPPDVISQFLLAVPMYLLFELGMIAAKTTERRSA